MSNRKHDYLLQISFTYHRGEKQTEFVWVDTGNSLIQWRVAKRNLCRLNGWEPREVFVETSVKVVFSDEEGVWDEKLWKQYHDIHGREAP